MKHRHLNNWLVSTSQISYFFAYEAPKRILHAVLGDESGIPAEDLCTGRRGREMEGVGLSSQGHGLPTGVVQ